MFEQPPEMEQFDSEADGRQAVERLTLSMIKDWRFWIVAGVVPAAIVLTLGWLLREFTTFSRLVSYLIAIAVLFATYVPWLMRGAARGQSELLRQQLRDRGIPVCLACGYSLKGLTTPDRCPECGGIVKPTETTEPTTVTEPAESGEPNDAPPTTKRSD